MSQICLNGICKSFKISQRPKGHLSLLKSAFIRETRIVNALKDIDFSIEEGELVGYIGPNGAGKSTTIKIKPDSMERPGSPRCPNRCGIRTAKSALVGSSGQ